MDDDDFITAAIPSCAVLRESMQSECWTPLVAPWERGKDAAEGSAQANCCDVLYEAALVACPNWPRTPRTPDGGRGIGASEGGDCTQMPHATIAPAATRMVISCASERSHRPLRLHAGERQRL